jgi:branched-chain amino acid aminotransferase
MDISVQLSTSRKPIPSADALSFGAAFTDHMFLAEYTDGQGWYSSRVVPYAPLTLDPSCAAIHYGQSMFEGMKAFRQASGRVALFRPDFHLNRMAQGAPVLCMQAPPVDLMFQGLKKLIEIDQAWVPKERGCALYIRPTLFASEGFLGVRPAKKLLFMIILSPVAAYYKNAQERLKIWVERKYVRAAPGGLGAVKASANYIAAMRAAEEAKANGYAQVLWTDAVTHEHIEEVGTMNVFFRFKDEVVTPELDGTILGGCTRDAVITLLREWKVPVRERRLSLTELRERHAKGELLEIFGSGTAASISPVGELGFAGGTLKLDGEFDLSERLRREILGVQYGEIIRPQWVHLI